MSVHSILSPIPELILFDADGTLYESERISFEASRLTALELYAFDLTWELFVEEVIRGTKTTSELLQTNDLTVDQDKIQAYKSVHYARIVAEELKPMPGLLKFLSWCKANQQSVACMIVSANRRKALDVSLKTLGITEFFQGIVSMEDTTGQYKPDPYPYQLGLHLVGIDAGRALAIEDTAKGIASAQAAGLRCIGIRNAINSPADLAAAELVINDYRDLLETE